jgi:hypothetical protein
MSRKKIERNKKEKDKKQLKNKDKIWKKNVEG